MGGVLFQKERVARIIDAERFSELFAAHAAQLALYARQWHDRAAAEDVVQEAYVRLMSQSSEPAHAKAWLFRTVRNEAISQARSSWRRQRRERSSPREEWFDPADGDAIDAAIATEALKSLSAPQREVIVLRIWGQMTLKETAEVTGSSTSTVFDHYRAGLAALRKKMGVLCRHNSQ